MNPMLGIRPFDAADAPAATAIIRGLPDYFTGDVPAKLERDAACGWRSTPPGAARATGPGCSATSWTTWPPPASASWEVKTLDRSAGYAPYEATRAFWERNGFVYLDMIDPLPDWQPGSPAAIYVAALRPTRVAALRPTRVAALRPTR
jgi:hypothetical protein